MICSYLEAGVRGFESRTKPLFLMLANVKGKRKRLPFVFFGIMRLIQVLKILKKIDFHNFWFFEVFCKRKKIPEF